MCWLLIVYRRVASYLWENQFFVKRSQYIIIENPLHKQAENAWVCFKTRCVRTCNFTQHLELPHNSFGPYAQIGQLFGIILRKKTLITCPLSMAPSIHLLLCTRLCCSNKELWLLYCLVYNELKWFLKEHSYYHAPFAFYEIFFKFIPVVLKDGSLTLQFILVLSFVHLVLLNHS